MALTQQLSKRGHPFTLELPSTNQTAFCRVSQEPFIGHCTSDKKIQHPLTRSRVVLEEALCLPCVSSLLSMGSMVPYKPFAFYYGILLGTVISIRCFKSLVQSPSRVSGRYSRALTIGPSLCTSKGYRKEVLPHQPSNSYTTPCGLRHSHWSSSPSPLNTACRTDLHAFCFTILGGGMFSRRIKLPSPYTIR